MRILLDTHVLLWWLDDNTKLSRVQADAITRSEKSGDRMGVASITFWEIAKLVEHERVRLRRTVDDLFDDLEAHPQVAVLPLSPRISLESTRLGARFHKDPGDQIIAATARVFGLSLVTADERMRASGIVSVF